MATPRLAAAGAQGRGRLCIARRDVVQHHDVGAYLLIVGMRLLVDRRFDQLDARLDMLDQGYEVRNNRGEAVISTFG